MENRTKLPESLTPYTVFENDQILTAKQINGFVSFLDGQHRLTKSKLIGYGNVCGHIVKFNRDTITITKGCSLTTDGDVLFYSSDMVFTCFSNFTDSNVEYPAFISQENQVPLLELHTKKTEKTNKLSTIRLELSNMVVLLYLESYEYDIDICTGSDCDNMGKEQRNNLKALLIKRSDLIKLLKLRRASHDLYRRILDIPCERVKLVPENISNLNDLHALYKNVLPGRISGMYKVLAKSYKECHSLLAGLYGTAPTIAWNRKFAEIKRLAHANVMHVQYTYDFLNDVATAHNEFRDSLFDIEEHCCPDAKLFPKHVMLGYVMDYTEGHEDPYRHGFYKSPALSAGQNRLEKLRFLHKRIDSLISNFKITFTKKIKVTPSKCAGSILGDRAIPAYYKTDGTKPVHTAWSYSLHKHGKSDTVYSYNADKYHGSPQALNPLDYCLSRFSFFMVEGFLGMDFQKAVDSINKLIKEFNLPFKVMALQIEKEVNLLPFNPPYWHHDLKDLHLLHRKMINFNIRNLDDFNDTVKVNVSATKELKRTEPFSSHYSVRDITEAKTTELKSHIVEIKKELKKPLGKFKQNKFDVNYKAAVQATSDMNKGLKGVVYNSSYTPYESLLNSPHYKWLGWVEERSLKRFEWAKKLSVFAGFLSEHPEMMHLCGVPWGGTLILVYSSRTREVIADFSLPHWHCCDIMKDSEDPEVDEVEDNDVIKWHKFNDFKITMARPVNFKTQIDDMGKIMDNKLGEMELMISRTMNAKMTNMEERIGNIVAGVSTMKVGMAGTTIVSTYLASNIEKTHAVIKGTTYAEDTDKIVTLSNRVAALDKSISEGTAVSTNTRKRIAAEKELETAITNTVKKVIKTAPADISTGSKEAVTMELVKEASFLIKDPKIRGSLKKNLTHIEESVSGRKHLVSGIASIRRIG